MPDQNHQQQRTELHRTIWNIANGLRGSVDGWDFKQYVLGMLFYRYISENLSAYIDSNQHEAGDPAFSYAQLTDDVAENARAELVNTKGFFILPSQLFENVRRNAPRDPDLNMTMAKIFDNIEASSQGAESEDDFKGLFDDLDVNSNKLGSTVAARNGLLVKLLDGVGEMALGNYQDNDIDAFGDAYEYLMSMYASNAGKSGGEFFTPQQVSELLTRLTLVGKREVNKVYDPACGSGSLLLKFAKILGKENVRQGFFGQEINLTTYNLCRINMFLHDIGFNKFNIGHGDTLMRPLHGDEEPFEAIVSNPPYSIHWEGNENPLLINDPRFSPAGVLAPKSNADFAFILHSLSWLATSGTAAIVCFPGILYRGGAEQKIRKYLIENNYIDCVIQLPDKLFFGTSIATCIVVLKKSKRDNSTLFIDASREFIKVTKNNLLTDENIERVLTLFENRMDQPYLARLVPNSEVAEHDFNLTVSTYVEKENDREAVDITQLNTEIQAISARVNQLREEIDAIVAEIESRAFSKLDGLIQALCPDGLESRVLDELVDYEQPTDYLVKSTDYRDGLPTPVLTAGASFILGYTDETDGVYPASENDPVIIFDDFTTSFHWVDFRFKVKSSAMKMLTSRYEHVALLRYLYYAMQHITYIPTQHARQWIQTYSKFTIPLPPLPVQEEIVRILDKLTILETELKAEIEVRSEQYIFYRDRLLSFKAAEK